MGNQQTVMNQEDVQAEQKTVAEKRSKVAESIMGGDLFKSLDLPTGDSKPKSIQEEQEEKRKAKEGDQDENEQQDSEAEEESQEETDGEAESSDETENELEDLIPKSKVQKRIDELTSKAKALERQVEELQAKSVVKRDEQQEKLDAMTSDELRDLKLNVRSAQMDSGADKERLRELIDLEMKIDRTVNDAPKKFVEAQVAAYEKAAARVASDWEGDLDKAAPKIVEIAKGIYRDIPSLSKDVNGQAIALELAVKHFKEVNKAPVGKSPEVAKLKSQVNNLKKKTGLDSKNTKGNVNQDLVSRLRREASGGTLKQKEALIRHDPAFNVDAMIPAEFLQSIS